MKVSTRYKNKHVTRKEFKLATVYMLAFLVDEKEHKEFDIQILSKKYQNKNDHDGMVISSMKSNKKFKIYIDPTISKERQLRALAHELVHCKQFYRKELGVTVETFAAKYTQWKGKAVNENDIDYDMRPWEVEAVGLENALLRRWEEFKEDEKLKFSQ
jgi:hypothetical protein